MVIKTNAPSSATKLRDMSEFQFNVDTDELTDSQLLAVCEHLGIKTKNAKGKRLNRDALEDAFYAFYDGIENNCDMRDAILAIGVSEDAPCFSIRVPAKRKYSMEETESGMVLEFHDSKEQRFSDEFNDWRRNHPNGYFLTFTGKNQANLHEAQGCWHIRVYDESYITVGGDASHTASRKVCAVSLPKLVAWAEIEGVTVKNCSHCFKGRHPDMYVPSQPQTENNKPNASSNADVSAQFAVLAVEGVLRETKVILKSRDGALRKAALVNARGVCAACGINYSRVLGGLGQRVLQVHHKRQLSLLDEPQVNGIEDLAVVCANCHQMIHSDMANAMPVEKLQKLLRNDVIK